MAESFSVTPPELRATARHLNDVSTRMKGVLSSLLDKLAAEGAFWGNDKIGVQFADGEAGYRARLDWVCGSVEAHTSFYNDVSQGLKSTADAHEQLDQV